MKIVRIIARLNIGGPARNAVLLSDNKDWKTVLVCGEAGANEGDMMYLAREKGIEPVIVKELGRELSPVNDWKAFRKIYGIISKERPDIVHTHTAKAGALGRLAGILYNLRHYPRRTVKLIHTFHGHVLHSYFGMARTCFFICIEKALALFTDRIIAVSSALKRELTQGFRVAPERKVSIVELGFELGDLLGLPPRGASDCINIGIVGRLVAVKNHRMIFRVLKRSVLKARLFIIGDGEMRTELESYVDELGIRDRVRFSGWIKDLKEIYMGLDIVALTSLNEGTPVSIIEAMAAGRPVVATDVGGVADIVEDGKAGYLVASNDDEGFVAKLIDLIEDSQKRRRFGDYGRVLAERRFSKERLINDTKKLYNEVLVKRKGY